MCPLNNACRPVAALVLALALSADTHAQFFTTYNWIDPLGGSYNSTGNWNGGGFPGIPNADDEGAFFNLDPSAYTVDFPTDVSTASATVRDGSVRFDLDPDFTTPRTYTLGTLTVDPAGGDTSLEVTNGTVDVAQLRVRNGGVLRTQATLNQNAGTVDIADGVGAVTGAFSRWSDDGDLELGRNGSTGTLNIENGGSVSQHRAFVGLEAGASGNVHVTGAGSTWTLSNTLFVGDAGSGDVLIEDGGSVFSHTTRLSFDDDASTGLVTVSGAGSNLNAESFILVGGKGEGRLRIDTGGSVLSPNVRIGGTTTSFNTGDPDPAFDGPGFVEVADPDTVFSAGTILVGGTGAGSLTISNGGSVISSRGNISPGDSSGFFPRAGEVLVTGADSSWEITNVLTLSGERGGEGTLTIEQGGAVTVVNDTILHPQTLVNLQGGTLATSAFDFQGGEFDWTSGTLHIDQFDGDLTNPTGGVLAPGRSAGTTDITGDYVQQAGGALEIEIGGTSISEHDSVDIDGSATLDGELQLLLINDFTPSMADAFTVLSAPDGIAGVFSNVTTGQRLDTVDGLGSFLVHYGATSLFNPNQVVLTAFEQTLLPGDYNADGTVDAADYTVWRDALGAAAGTLPNDTDGGVIGAAQYTTWKNNFGLVSGALRVGSSPIPEPASCVSLCMSVVVIVCLRRKHRPR